MSERTVVRIYFQGDGEVFAQWRFKGITNMQAALINARLDTIKLELVDGMREATGPLPEDEADDIDRLLDNND